MLSKTRQAAIMITIGAILIPILLLAGNTGKIRGIITDKITGDPIPGVSVSLIGTALGAVTDSDGKFLIEMIKPGIYTLEISSAGYNTVEIDSVVVKSDFTFFQNMELTKLKNEHQKVIRITADKSAKIEQDFKALEGIQDQYMMLDFAEKNQLAAPASEAESIIRTRDSRYKSPVEKKAKYIQNIPPAHGGTAIVNGEPYDAMFFKSYGTNPFVDTEDDHLSTFAIDTDDASFIMARSYLERGNLPPAEAIRVEEFINHFDYGYKAPRREPFQIYLEGGPSEFGQNSQMLKIGIKGRQIESEDRKPANLIFVIDVSGSMNRENRLGLVKRALRMLVDELNYDDNVGIVVYGSHGEILLEPTSIYNRHRILRAIDNLHPDGSTNADEGLRLAYNMADRYFEEGKINRIILCSDGVANVGLTSADDLLKRIKKYANQGITLSAIGFGMGNYNDILMEKLGNKGNGYYAYVDDLNEAHRIFVENLTGSLEVIARDVKIQVDFDPDVVRSYRLLGYENRDVDDNKFRDDREDGGEIGAGHEVTALYEIKLRREADKNRLGNIYIRYKDPDSFEVDEIKVPIKRSIFSRTFRSCSEQFKLAAVAAEFSEILRKSYWAKNSSLTDLRDILNDSFYHTNNDEVIELQQLISKTIRFQDDLAER